MTVLNLKPILKNRTLRADVVEKLKDAIISGDLPPGTKLVESQLSSLLGVSRGPLREAIRQLAEQGLIDNIPYTGTYVANITVQAIRELYSFRTELEQFAFKLVWEQRDDAFHDELILQLEKLSLAIKSDDHIATIFEELELHNVVYKHCGHALLQDTWQRLRGRLHLYFTLHQKAHNRTGPYINAHDKYVKLALGDDLPAMLDHITEHMQQGYQKVESLVSEIESQN
ncbi:GntR family transcriptional regulator [Marinomonas sp. 2405UD68-3]|uniref:GntR family transcriptional regulator n=1 Tax=Marinomonas sp. 2405UD68-3 TaxID=3391835 RepID=UPI0039C8D159